MAITIRLIWNIRFSGFRLIALSLLGLSLFLKVSHYDTQNFCNLQPFFVQYVQLNRKNSARLHHLYC
jgi:hypothetical protein